MGNFETIVRPVVFPNIRPVQPRSVAPEDDPEKGLARINGQSGKIVSLPYNFTHNISRTKQTEIKRRVDEVRVFQKEGEGDDATINRDNYLDVEITNKLWVAQPGARGTDTSGPGEGTPGTGSDDLVIPTNYAPVEEKDNIEIRKRNVIKKNVDYSGPGSGTNP